MLQKLTVSKSFQKIPLLLTILTITLFPTPTLQAMEINQTKFKGIYDYNGLKRGDEAFNFSKGSWCVFTKIPKDGRIMEYHPKVDSFVKFKTGGVVTSMAFYEPGGRVIAFYADKNPMPKSTMIKSNAFTKGPSAAANKVAELKKKNGNILSYVNNVPAFTMYDFVKTNPFPFYKYWTDLTDQLDDDYMNVPYNNGYEITKDDLRNFYRKVAKYFTIMTLFPTEYPIENYSIDEFFDKEEVVRDNEFEEDLLRPMNTHTYMNIKNPLHLHKSFKLATQLMNMVARQFLIKTLFFSETGMKKAGAFSADSFNDLITKNLNYSKSYLFTGFTFGLFKSKYNFKELTNNREVLIYEHIFDTLVEVYNAGFHSYDNFVQWRGKKKNGSIRKRYKILSKDDVKVMDVIFKYFKEVIYPKIVSEVVGMFLDCLKESQMFEKAGLADILSQNSRKYATFKKYMKMMGYMGFTDSDIGMLKWHSFPIFIEK